MTRPLILLLALLVSSTAIPSQAADSVPFWKIQNQKATVYLLAVLPFAAQGMYPLPPNVEKAFEQSTTLLVYTDLLELAPQAASDAAAKLGTLAGTATLSDTVSADTWRRFEAQTRELGVAPSVLSRQEPWLAAWSLNWLVFGVEGFDEGRSVERDLLRRARNTKTITSCRSYTEWLSELDQLSVPEQELLLRVNLARLEQGRAYPTALADAWLKGDLARLSDLLSKDLGATPGADDLIQRLVQVRRSAMVERMKPLLQHDGDTFVVVSVEQVIGANSIPVMLRQAGFDVTRY